MDAKQKKMKDSREELKPRKRARKTVTAMPLEAMPRPEEMRRGWRLFLIHFVNFFLCLFKPYRIRGKENMTEEEPHILMANHVSNVDPVVISIKTKVWMHWIAKEELFRYPIIRHVLYGWGALPLERTGSDFVTARSIFRYLKDGRSIGIFPQGTRCTSLERIKAYPPKAGAYSLAKRRGIKIQPVAIEGRVGLFRPMVFHYLPVIDPRDYRPDLPDDEARLYALFETIYETANDGDAARFYHDLVAEKVAAAAAEEALGEALGSEARA